MRLIRAKMTAEEMTCAGIVFHYCIFDSGGKLGKTK